VLVEEKVNEVGVMLEHTTEEQFFAFIHRSIRLVVISTLNQTAQKSSTLKSPAAKVTKPL
jgi:hypothetical protein